MHYFPLPDEVLEEHVFHFLTCHRDRNAVSLVCKSWYSLERFSRFKVSVRNCYAISPERVVARFPNLTSLTIKGKPDSFVFTDVHPDWGGSVHPWIETMVSGGVNLEELRLKRMVVPDETLHLLSLSFPNFKSLVLVNCESFSTAGLASIAFNCRFLKELDLQQNAVEVEDDRGEWLSYFPDSCTTLVSLNFACLQGEVNLEDLERLVARCPNLTSLRLNDSVPLDVLLRILVQAPQLVDLGVGTFVDDPVSETYNALKKAIHKCTSIRSLSGFFIKVDPRCLSAIYPICQSLTSLDLSSSPLHANTLRKLIRHCPKLERLWIQDTIGDKGLSIVASTCRELQELKVFAGSPYFGVTEEGVVAVSVGCPKLKSLLYKCEVMTNAALIALAKNCPNLIRFILYTRNPKVPDPVTKQPLDEGFGAIVRTCRGLERLRLAGLLTDQVLLYIGKYAEQLKMLTIPFAGDSDTGMLHVLNGCKKLKELNIRDSPFGNVALLADTRKYEMMRSVSMLSCQVTLGACKALAEKMPRLNVEIISPRQPLLSEMSSSDESTSSDEYTSSNEDTSSVEYIGSDNDDRVEEYVEIISPRQPTLNAEIISPRDDDKIDKIYLYRTMVGARKDTPDFVEIL